MLDTVDLPDDIAALKAMLIASQLREVRKDDRIERLEKLAPLTPASTYVPLSFQPRSATNEAPRSSWVSIEAGFC
ncbi:hypothetical protein SAMN03159288_03694 [Rhizobium sp. NFACC06-2]|nr:hypothetical protein SAMN03159288_03694 [Rhizobium sp. NFACC06-2]